MNNLKTKILKKIYQYETKQTATEIIIRFLSIIAVMALYILMVFELTRQLVEQQTLDVLQLFGESTEVIFTHINDVIEILYYELPVDIIILIFILGSIFLLLTFLLIRKRNRIINKTKQLIKFWKKTQRL